MRSRHRRRPWATCMRHATGTRPMATSKTLASSSRIRRRWCIRHPRSCPVAHMCAMWPTLHTTHCPISRGQGFDTLLLRIEDTLLCDAVLHIATAFGWRHLRLDLVSMETTATCLRTACWQTQRIPIYVQSNLIRTRSISNISHFFYSFDMVLHYIAKYNAIWQRWLLLQHRSTSY